MQYWAKGFPKEKDSGLVWSKVRVCRVGALRVSLGWGLLQRGPEAVLFAVPTRTRESLTRMG